MDRDEDIRATFQGGVFKPDGDPGLPEGTKVSIRRVPRDPTPESIARAVELLRRVRREGLVKLSGPRWNREDLYDRR